MKLSFLGTGAADWELSKHKDVPGFRRNSALLIDGCLLIDPGPDVPDALATFGKDAGDIRYVINTHKHRDHYNKDTLDSLGGATFYPLADGETVTFGKYTVTAYAANHATCEGTVHFIISDGERKLFYGLDGAWLNYKEARAIRDTRVDLAVMDATIGEISGDWRIFEHNNLNMVREIKATLGAYVGRWIISHLARTLHPSHDEVSESMKKYDIEVAYDGFETEI